LAAGSAAVFTEVALPDGNWRDVVEQVKLRSRGSGDPMCRGGMRLRSRL
jgi:hypothetical protein